MDPPHHRPDALSLSFAVVGHPGLYSIRRGRCCDTQVSSPMSFVYARIFESPSECSEHLVSMQIPRRKSTRHQHGQHGSVCPRSSWKAIATASVPNTKVYAVDLSGSIHHSALAHRVSLRSSNRWRLPMLHRSNQIFTAWFAPVQRETANWYLRL